MAKSIGIDLGTTNSVAAIKRLDVSILKNNGDDITRSCVGLEGGGVIVGNGAYQLMKNDPKNTIRSVKRLMGRDLDDERVKEIREANLKRGDYEITSRADGTENSLAVILGGRQYTPEQVSAEILKHIKGYAHEALQDEPKFAVITVPAYFNDRQKHATRMAAHLAGFNVLRLLPEPTAAAISFGVDEMEEGEAKTVLIFDFGGGTFDLSILTIADGQFLEQGKGGDMWLGGDDIDERVRNYVYTVVEAEYDIDDLDKLVAAMPEGKRNLFAFFMKEQVEQAKIRLTTHEEASVDVLGILEDDDGDLIDIQVDITRESFETLITDTIDRTVDLCKQLIEDVHYTPDLIDAILLIGGSSGIPLVRRKLGEAFGADKVHVHPRPMLAVAEGAAMLAHRLSSTIECPSCGSDEPRDAKACSRCDFDLIIPEIDVVHSASHDYSIRLEGGDLLPLVDRNAILPIKVEQIVATVADNQRLIHVEFVNTTEGIQEVVGSLWLSLNDSFPRGTEIVVGAEIGMDGVLSTSASLRKDPSVRVARELARGGNAVERAFLELKDAIDYVNRGDFVPARVRGFLSQCPRLIQLAEVVESSETQVVNDEALKEFSHRLNGMREEVAAKYRNVDNLVSYTNVVLASYEELMGPEQTQQIRTLRDELVAINDSGSQSEIDNAFDRLDTTLDTVQVVNILMYFRQASAAVAVSDPSLSSRIDVRHSQILDAIVKNHSDRARELFDEIWPTVVRIMEEVNNVVISTQVTLTQS